MKLVVRFDTSADVIEISQNILPEIKKLQDDFLKWLFDKNNNHDYWWYENGNKVGCSYRSEAFCEYLNKFYLAGSGAKTVISDTQEYDGTLPVIDF
jgi:hypothetical protein